MSNIPVCLVFAGHDPSGGAGIQADIEALASNGCHAVTLVTCLTRQDTSNIYSIEARPASQLVKQACTLLADITVRAIKIGLVPSVEIAEAIHVLLKEYEDVPIILDPVLWASGGQSIQDDETREAMKSLLFPSTTILTPNGPEARSLAPAANTLDNCGIALLDQGCEYVLISGGHEKGQQVINNLYSNRRCLKQFCWPRLQGEFHGTGCTLASSIAGFLAHGHELLSAVHEAQEYTWNTLKHAYCTGKGKLQPHRFF